MSELNELFERDPEKLTDQDIFRIIAKMREHQAQFELGVKAPAKPKAASTKSSKVGDILKDLGLT